SITSLYNNLTLAIKMIKRWTLKPADEQITEHLHQVLKVSPVLCRLLTIRGVKDYESAKAFFRPGLSQLHDPFLMKGMTAPVDRITYAFEWHEKILVYVDYDVDGTTAVSVMYAFLRSRYAGDITYYIP